MSSGSSEEMNKRDQITSRQAEDASMQSLWESNTSAQRKELNDLYEEDIQQPAGSAALGGDDASPPASQAPRRNLETQPTYEDIGFASMGIGSDLSFQDFSQRHRDFSHPQSSQRMHPEPLSPTYTNPYQSPEGEKAVPNQMDHDESESQNIPYQNGPFARGLPSQLEQADRSQTSSTGVPRAFPSLSNLSGLGGGNGPWSAAPGAVGTPSRAFGESAYGGFGDITSPASAGFGSGFFGSSGPSGASISASTRGSKLGPLYPSALQDQSRIDSQRQEQGMRSPA